MKKHLLKILVGLSALVITFLAVLFLKKDKYEYKQEIKPPVPANDITYEQYSFNADSGVVIERSTGTLIKIPASAFINSKGEVVKGNVSLSVREFHTSEDLFRSGIPMSIDSSRQGFLASAGMIELRATANGDKLELAENKNAEVSLASFKNAEGYRLYHLKDDKNWNVIDTFANVKNERKSIKLNALNQQLSEDTTDEMIVDLVSDLEATPELVPFKGLQWKVKVKDITEKFQEAMRVHWNDIKISRRGSRYKFDLKLVMSNYGEKEKVFQKFSFFATPVKNGNRLSNKDFDEINRLNDSVKVRIKEEIQRVEKEADLLNSFKINQMGIWNVDKLMNIDDANQYKVGFDFESEFNLDYSKILLYVLYLDENSVVPFNRKAWDKIPLKSGSRVMMKAVLPNGKTAVVDEKDINQQLNNSTKELFFKTKKL